MQTLKQLITASVGRCQSVATLSTFAFFTGSSLLIAPSVEVTSNLTENK
jgi:hypothetical protein